MKTSIVKKVNSFITFDLPLEKAYIASQFFTVHEKFLVDSPKWSTTATRQRLIADYWYTYVISHFAVLFVVPTLVVVLFSPNFTQLPLYLPGIFLAGVLSFLVLYGLVYLHYFKSFFLPQLETVKEEYENQVEEQLAKCRQAQLSNLALALIFYVFDKTSGINKLQCNDKYAELLMNMYGVDQGSLKKNLALILGKKDSLGERKKTETIKWFDEAISFFGKVEFEQGIQILEKLKTKFES